MHLVPPSTNRILGKTVLNPWIEAAALHKRDPVSLHHNLHSLSKIHTTGRSLGQSASDSHRIPGSSAAEAVAVVSVRVARKVRMEIVEMNFILAVFIWLR